MQCPDQCARCRTCWHTACGVAAAGNHLPNVTYVVSESFVVATKRVKHAIKSDIPSIGDHISKLVHIGKATVDKLQVTGVLAAPVVGVPTLALSRRTMLQQCWDGCSAGDALAVAGVRGLCTPGTGCSDAGSYQSVGHALVMSLLMEGILTQADTPVATGLWSLAGVSADAPFACWLCCAVLRPAGHPECSSRGEHGHHHASTPQPHRQGAPAAHTHQHHQAPAEQWHVASRIQGAPHTQLAAAPAALAAVPATGISLLLFTTWTEWTPVFVHG